MRWVLFMNRITLVCNISFFLMFIIKDLDGLEHGQFIINTILVLAVIAFFLNFATIIITTIFYFFKKFSLPKYLFLINIVFFLLEYYYYFIS